MRPDDGPLAPEAVYSHRSLLRLPLTGEKPGHLESREHIKRCTTLSAKTTGKPLGEPLLPERVHDPVDEQPRLVRQQCA